MSSQPDACERLAQSREHLRQAMQEVSTRSTDADGAGADSLLGSLLDSLQTTPGGSLLGDVLATWWRKQPLGGVVQLIQEAAKVLMQPVARRHPYKLVLGAAAAGGLLVLLRPWRWTSTRALAAGLLPQIMSLVFARDRHDSHL